MKLIITIPKDKYRYIQKLEQDNTDYATTRMLYHAVKHGKPYLKHNKQIPQQVELEGDGYDPDGNLVYDYAQCPNCQRAFEESDENWECGYCPCCGQALKWWGDEEGDE